MAGGVRAPERWAWVRLGPKTVKTPLLDLYASFLGRRAVLRIANATSGYVPPNQTVAPFSLRTPSPAEPGLPSYTVYIVKTTTLRYSEIISSISRLVST